MPRYLSLAFILFCLLTACVTINVYFPEAKAREAAEKTVSEIMGVEQQRNKDDGASLDIVPQLQRVLVRSALTVVDWFLPAAHAASPGEEKIKAVMQQRYLELEVFLTNGVVGFTHDGLVAIRDLNLASARDRAKVRTLVDADNADRQALYQESARALGNPQWVSRQQAIYAQEWIKQAKAQGFWYQDEKGSWVK